MQKNKLELPNSAWKYYISHTTYPQNFEFKELMTGDS